MIVISKTLGASLCFFMLLLVNWNYHSWKKKKERGELREELRALTWSFINSTPPIKKLHDFYYL
jgi:hypothetical protein